MIKQIRRKTTRLVAVSAIVVIAAVLLTVSFTLNRQGPSPLFFFIQMTDPQLYGEFGERSTVDLGLGDEDELFEAAIQHANTLKPRSL